MNALPARRAGDQIDRDIVIVPCWRRPEMLWHCLDNLRRADGIQDTHIIFRADHGYDPDNAAVIESFAPQLGSYEVQPAIRCPYRRTKLSANILFGYLGAMAIARKFVYLVEEDIMVGRDFFRWHRSVHERKKDLFCTIAVRNHNRNIHTPDDVDGYYLSSDDYCSWGVCFDASVIHRLVTPHVCVPYLSRPKPYLRRTFPSSGISLGYVEQASLIRRIQESARLPIAFSSTPRAFHAGFYGRNRPGAVEGSLNARVQRLSDIIYDREAMRAVALSSRYAQDSQPVALNTLCSGDVHEVRVTEVQSAISEDVPSLAAMSVAMTSTPAVR